MNALFVRVVDSPAEAPNYKGGDFKAATLEEAVVVRKGTVEGNCTVDLVLKVIDKDGNATDMVVAMTTGKIITMLASCIKGAEERKD